MYQVKPPMIDPPVRLPVDIEYSNVKDPNACLVWIPKLEHFNKNMHDMVTDNKRFLYLKDIAGLPVGHVPWGLSGAFRRLIDNGCTIFAHPDGEPVPSFPPWPHMKDKGGGVVIPCTYVIQLKHVSNEEALNMLKQAVAGMSECEVITVTSDTTMNEKPASVTPTPSYPAYDIIRKVISDEREVDYIRGDGNCFFRAISKVITTDSENRHEELRQVTVDFLKDNIVHFEQFVDGPTEHHISSMYKVGTWATQAEIYAVATMLQRDLYILSPCGEDTDCYCSNHNLRITLCSNTTNVI